MKRTLSLLAAIAATVLLTSGKPIKVACIGDSITYGSRIEDKEHDSYPAVLQRLLGDAYEVRNFGFSARTMLMKGDHPYMQEEMYQEAKAFLPDIVTIMLGTNDTKPFNWQYGDEFKSDYLRMVEELSNIPSRPRIYLCLPPKTGEDRWGINDSTIVAGVIPAVKEIADRCWINVIDTYNTLGGKLEFFADGIHPNPTGAAMIAKEIYDGLSEYGDTGKPGKRILFIGDSITDGDWGKRDGYPSEKRNVFDMNHVYGHGYQSMIAARMLSKYPQKNYRFFNRGSSGDTLEGLCSRWEKDALSLHPDVISILIGINETIYIKDPADFDIEGWDKMYRDLLDRTLAFDKDIKLVLCTPFLEEVGAVSHKPTFAKQDELVANMAEKVRRIAADYNATLIPFDNLISELRASDKSGDAKYWVWDGVHPTMQSHARMAELWMKKVKL